jgi:hypothetical protein
MPGAPCIDKQDRVQERLRIEVLVVPQRMAGLIDLFLR